MEFSKRVQEVQPSATLAITSKAKLMLNNGDDVVILAAGEPDFDTPEIVKAAAIKAINEGFTKYTPAGGTVSLKEAICRKLRNENNLEYNPENIVVSCGAKHSLYNIFQILCDPGDEVLIISPYWLSYPEMVRLAGGIPRFLITSRENGYKAGPEDIQEALTDRTKAVILNSPSNPAGVVYEKNELEAIAKVCVERGIKIISDEIYEKIIFDGKKHISIAIISDEVKKSTIVVNGVSKSFSMTGWRIGYTAGGKDIIKKIQTLQSHSTSNPCSISQKAAECALLTDMDAILEANRKEFEKRRDLLMKLLDGEAKIKPFKPEGAFYLFCDISATGMDSMTFSEKLLAERQVAVIPGGPFGEGNSVRISFATSEKVIEEGIKRIKDWVK
ncbi:MAG: pyridoxal phosphate-dependent aminotransferase [Candidatus Omnitrophica bacterium]|nr:pyridoxal phosphate-dependent aminotransferase [Candidatus Omnitrophota bacterium]MBU1785160.1 pyridoxal phosphate-dependent aminotransferase [Candidatus Omnitrophota bacterium]MBU1852186.1 pyridoxal phosphate-dependent aminotransferase [Candidatus Omnitrophota bacterium]